MKNLASVFKKAAGSAQNVFKKSSDVAQNVFSKASDVAKNVREDLPKVAGKIAEGAQSTADVLDKVSKISGKIARNPITASVPLVGGAIATGAGALSSASKLGATGARQVSNLANPLNYKPVRGQGSLLENARDIQRRTAEIADTGRQAQSMFA